MDALTFLRAEHKSVLGMLRGTSDGAPRRRRDRERFGHHGDESDHRRIAAWCVIEEQLFWAGRPQGADDGDALADHAAQQEAAAKHLLQRLEDACPVRPTTKTRWTNSSRSVSRTHPVRAGRGVAAVLGCGRRCRTGQAGRTAGGCEEGGAHPSAPRYAVGCGDPEDHGDGRRRRRPRPGRV